MSEVLSITESAIITVSSEDHGQLTGLMSWVKSSAEATSPWIDLIICYVLIITIFCLTNVLENATVFKINFLFYHIIVPPFWHSYRDWVNHSCNLLSIVLDIVLVFFMKFEWVHISIKNFFTSIYCTQSWVI